MIRAKPKPAMIQGLLIPNQVYQASRLLRLLQIDFLQSVSYEAIPLRLKSDTCF